jgi:hypothetical protein
MIAFDDEQPLAGLIARVSALNETARRADERVRLSQVPLEHIV